MTYSELVKQKILNQTTLRQHVAVWKLRRKKIVFTNGCFDILHLGHADYLAQAKSKGDILIVGLNTDASVRRQGKGSDRPLNNESSRAFLIASLQFVDAVVLFDEDTPLELIKSIEPDVLVKGSDYKPEEIVGYKEVTEKGGTVETIALVNGYSTTALIEKIRRTG